VGPDPTTVLDAAWQDSELHARAGALGTRLRAAGGQVRAADLVQSLTGTRSTAAV